jgi:hypothetical protein
MADEQAQTEEQKAEEAKTKREAVLKDLIKDNGAPKRHSKEPAVSDFSGDPQETDVILSQLHAQGYVILVANDNVAEDGVTHAHQLIHPGLVHAKELGLVEEDKPEQQEDKVAGQEQPAQQQTTQ